MKTIVETKRCHKCGLIKSVTEFRRLSKTDSQLRNKCKSCQRVDSIRSVLKKKASEKTQRFVEETFDDLQQVKDKNDVNEEKEFALECHLRDYLAQGQLLSIKVEDGLKLEHSGKEYPVDGGFIDLFAMDCNGIYVVCELKVSRGHEKTVGQLAYYMACVDKKFGGKCRGLIIASDISDKLRMAASMIPRVETYVYNMDFTCKQVC